MEADEAHDARGNAHGTPAFPNPNTGVEDPQLLYMRVGCMRGGWIGLHPWHGKYALAIADFGLDFVSVAVTIHELFHLMRHVQGIATFEEEARARGLKKYVVTAREEGLVWWKTWGAEPLGVVVIICATFFTVYTAAYLLYTLVYELHSGALALDQLAK